MSHVSKATEVAPGSGGRAFGRDPRPYARLPILITLMTLVALVTGAVALFYVERRLVATAGENLALGAAEIADNLDRLFFERHGDTEMMARAFAYHVRDPAYMDRYMKWMKGRYPAYLWLGVTDADGRVIAASSPESLGRDFSRTAWFQDALLNGTSHVGDVEPYEVAGGVDSVAFTAPIINARGEFLGVTSTRVGLPSVEEIVTRTIRAFRLREEFLGEIEYQFLTHTGLAFIDSDLMHKGNVNLKQLGLPSALLGEQGTPGYVEEQHLRRHVPVVTGYAMTSDDDRLQDLRWSVLLRMDRRDILAPIYSVLWKLGLAGALVFVPMLAVLLWSVNRLQREWAQADQESANARAAEAALRESEAKTRVILETALDAVVGMDATGHITEWNAQAEAIFGWTRAEAIGLALAQAIIPFSYREAHERGLRRFLVSGEGPLLNRRIEITACDRQGREFPVELSISPSRQGGAYTFSAFVRDITKRRQTEKRQAAQLAVSLVLADSRTIGEAAPKLLQAICETAGWEVGGIWHVDKTVSLLRCDAVWQISAEHTEEFASLTREITFPLGIGLPGRVWDKREPAWIPDVLKDSNFPRAPVAAKAGLHGAIGFPILLGQEVLGVLEFFSREVREPDGELVQMMTEIGIKVGQLIQRGLLEEQLRQSQKMEAIGRLAGGIAHDFNNVLTVITGYSQMLLGQMDRVDPHRESLEEIRKAGDRAAALTSQLLAFSRRQVLAPKVLDLNALLCGMDGMLRRLIGEHIELRMLPGRDVGSVKADPGQIEQVVMNLAINAGDAMPQGGRLTIETGNVEPDAVGLHQAGPAKPTPYVVLAVSDTGYGMDADTQAHIFEPFFTTKGRGKGTGLGLATVYGIVQQSDGHIHVSSKPGRGTTVKVFLPRAPGDQPVAAEPAGRADKPCRGSETVLLVEDESSIRIMMGRELQAQGYQVLEAEDGADALKRAREHKGPVDLLLTDVVMPRLGGRELAEELAALRPDMKVLFMSGYTDDEIVRHGVLRAQTAFIQKPFAPSELARKVREVLDTPPPPGQHRPRPT